MDRQRVAVVSSRATERLAVARRWLSLQGRAANLLIVGATMQAAADLTRTLSLEVGGSFGWRRFTLVRLAWALADVRLAEANRVPASSLALEALCARVVHDVASEGALGRFSAIADRPGFPRALARTVAELRFAKVNPADLGDKDLATLVGAYERERVRAGLADRAELFEFATEVAKSAHPLLGFPLLFLDVPLARRVERELAHAVIRASTNVVVTACAGDERTISALGELGLSLETLPDPSDPSALDRLQAGLFAKGVPAPAPEDDSVTFFSAPGESRECVEIVRRIHREAKRGITFDRMAVLLRAPLQYRSHLREAFRRGGIPGYFARGTTRPDPAGRAFLALLGCAASGLSASRFAEYLSLGEVPDATNHGAPPPALSNAERWVPPDDELDREPPQGEEPAAPELPAREQPVTAGTLRAPRLWERLLLDAAVIGGLDRWERRLNGLRNQLEVSLAEVEDDEAMAQRLQRDLDALAALRDYALPLLEDLATLPRQASWGQWLDRLGALATRALRDPERVLRVLAQLAPMASVGPVDLREVRLVLEKRLTELAVVPPASRYGRVFVASTEDVRGRDFDIVFVPGLAEKLFPQKVVEDPFIPDSAREGTDLPTNRDRASAERLALRLAVGSTRRRAILSYPRLDVEQGRPRTPSFYGLEVLRAAEGKLPGFGELARRANVTGAVRVGWPAPEQPGEAIDDAEHDLALLDGVLRRPEAEAQGMAHYLLSSNVHLARALRFRARRWLRRWTEADGLVEAPPEAQEALSAHALNARSYSPTGLQNYAACPYRFLLQAIHRLAPREAPGPLEELDPLERGSLIHDAQFEFYSELWSRGLLPVTAANLDAARETLDRVLGAVVARYKDKLAPAVDRVWDNGVAAIRADLREWLRLASLDATWKPEHFELSFGLPPGRARDPRSRDEAVALDCGIALRGSIDLVERSRTGALRATDHKTGKAHAKPGIVIGRGQVLQPVFYALALERLLPGAPVEEGRLYYCTAVGEYQAVSVPLTEEAREAARQVATTIRDALAASFLPAAPAEKACQYCDYQRVCGPYEERRVERKPRSELLPLHALRRQP